MIPKNIKTPLYLLILLAAPLIAFWGVWNFNFVFYDDINYVKENPFVLSGLSIESIHWAFTSYIHHVWHPFTWLSFMVDTEIYGTGPAGYHFTNLILHLLNTGLLFAFLCLALKDKQVAFLTALIFSIHPLRVESVVWISERKDVLSFFFMMLAFLAYHGSFQTHKKLWYLAGTFIFFACGLMSKMILVIFPVLLLLLDYWPYQRHKKNSWQSLILEKILFFITALAASLWNLFTYKSTGLRFSVPDMTALDRVYAVPMAYGEYFLKTFWPTKLTVYQYHHAFSVYKVAGVFLLLVLITFVFVRNRKTKPYLLMGWFWFLAALLPVIGIVQFTMTRIGDRFTYIPHMGLLVALIWFLKHDFKTPRILKYFLRPGLITLIVVLMALTRMQSQTWQNSKTLFQQAIRVNGNFHVTLNNIANELAQEGRRVEALEHYAAILEEKPRFLPAYFNAGKLLEIMGQKEESKQMYLAILELDPKNERALNILESFT